jgi:hypothetical protein
LREDRRSDKDEREEKGEAAHHLRKFVSERPERRAVMA